jgi:anti-sigma regulatory factor (Ser/Thr protein kinase)
LLYTDMDGFLAGTVPFLQTGAEAGEPMLVVVSESKIGALRDALDDAADTIHFADMAQIGHNPARIIPAWRSFLDDHGGGTRRVRGIGEPIWAGRTPDQLVECQRHESLLNVAFADSGDWSLLCPYDTSALPPAVIEEAARSHPTMVDEAGRRQSDSCLTLDAMRAPFDAPLPAPPPVVLQVDFDSEHRLPAVRDLVAREAVEAGLSRVRAEELVLSAHEAAANSLRYGGGAGTLRLWSTADAVICEVSDTGHLDLPLVGRERPIPQALSGRGLWMANQLCDLVQLRTFPDGNVVRLHMFR